MKTIIVTLLLMVAAAEQATAANILVTNETTIYIGGELLVGDDARFQNALTPEIRRINLASNGGALNTALRIGQLVRERKLETVVYNGAQCASACALIWLAGSKRYLNQGARIGRTVRG